MKKIYDIDDICDRQNKRIRIVRRGKANGTGGMKNRAKISQRCYEVIRYLSQRITSVVIFDERTLDHMYCI